MKEKGVTLMKTTKTVLMILLRFVLAFSFLSPSFQSDLVIPCPYLSLSHSPLSPSIPQFNITRIDDYGRLGNMVTCASNAMDLAIRCHGQVNLPPIPTRLNLSIARTGMSFDFSSLAHPPLTRPCKQQTSGCKTFFNNAKPDTSSGLSNYHPDPLSFPILARCFNKYLSFPPSLCTLDLDHSLVVHIRNGDVYNTKAPARTYGQQPMCALVAAMLHRPWDKIVVLSEVQNPNDHRSGPLMQFLRAIQNVFSAPIVFLPGNFPTHFNVRMCAVNLYIAHTTLNYLNHYLPRLRTLYDPMSTSCPLFTPKYGWSSHSNVTVYHMTQKAIDWGEDKWEDNSANWLKMLLSPCVKFEACVPTDRHLSTSVSSKSDHV